MFWNAVMRVSRRAIAALRRPWVSATLITMMLVDACSLPRTTVVGGSVPTPRCRCWGWWRPAAIVVQVGESLRLIDEHDEAAMSADYESVVATLHCSPYERTGGFWAVTRAWWDPAIRVYAQSRNLTAAEVEALRPQFADIIERGEYSSLSNYADLIRTGAGPFKRIVWSGYVHNAISLMLAWATLISFGWVRERSQARRHAALMAIGCCPDCQYDLRGDLQRGCPECGWRRGANLGASASTARAGRNPHEHEQEEREVPAAAER